MAWYYNVISRRELRFKRLVVLRGTVHMPAWQEAQTCAAKGQQVRAILLHSYETNSRCTHQEARWQNQRIRNLPEMEVKKRPACEGGATDRDRLSNSSGLTQKSYTVISYSLKNEIVKEEIEIQFFCLFPISLLTVACKIILPGTRCRQPLDKWLQSGYVTAIMSDTAGACWRANTVICMGQTMALRGPQPDILAPVLKDRVASEQQNDSKT